MIIYDLTCEHNHRFEGWFSSISDFEKQQTDKFISCPTCGNSHIQIRPSVSHVDTLPIDAAEADEMATTPNKRLTSQEIFSQLIEHVINNNKNKGDTFVDEIHKINGQEYEIRYISDTNSLEEIRDLIEEGVELLPLALKLPGKLH